MVGLVIFTASSFFCGFANSAGVLIGARVVQGSERRDEPGDALDHRRDVPAAAARDRDRDLGRRLRDGARDRPARRRRDHGAVNWSWVFYINVPIGILGFFAARLFIDESKDTREQRLDLAGPRDVRRCAVRADLRADRVEQARLGRPFVLGLFAVAAVLFVVFILLERHQRLPMLDLNLFRNRSFSSANAVMFLIGLAMFGVVLLHVALRPERPPLLADPGRRDVPADDDVIIFVAPVAGRLADKVGPRRLMVPASLVAVSLVLFSLLDETRPSGRCFRRCSSAASGWRCRCRRRRRLRCTPCRSRRPASARP